MWCEDSFTDHLLEYMDLIEEEHPNLTSWHPFPLYEREKKEKGGHEEEEYCIQSTKEGHRRQNVREKLKSSNWQKGMDIY